MRGRIFVFKTIVAGTVFLFTALLAGPWLAMQFDASYPPINLGHYRHVGTALFVIGFVVALYCTYVLFSPAKIRPAPFYAGGVFIIGGPYSYVRNPFLLAVIIALWGEAIYMQRFAMVAYALIFTWLIHFWVVFFEEPVLEKRFPKEYPAYREVVPRWFPKFRKYER
jgi:protein-S-isoprenylcysteine O-methyltransferase Ste14